MSEAILRIEKLKKSFGPREVLRQIDMEIMPGEVVCLIGSSGSGKSTLLRCINLLEQPTGGAIYFKDQNILEKKVDQNQYCSKVGMVFQQFNLFNNMTALKNCTYAQMKALGRSEAEAEENAKKY
ncbi:MAG: ATP-binding cassette domain-containing protein, partial [Peptococcus niger]